MARIARVVVPGLPHHVTQRGNRRMDTFFKDGDYKAYLSLMSDSCLDLGVQIWAYCLMPNHVHIIAIPKSEDGLRRAIGDAHRRYSRLINSRHEWRGHLWQGRFGSTLMDERYLLTAVRYIELNPVRAKLCNRPEDWKWSSALAHMKGRDDVLVKVRPMLALVEDWADYLSTDATDGEMAAIRKHERTGRPLGGPGFVEKVGKQLGRHLQPGKRGPKMRRSRRK